MSFRAACMTPEEYRLWEEANAVNLAVSTKAPCADCTNQFADEMTRELRCNRLAYDGLRWQTRRENERKRRHVERNRAYRGRLRAEVSAVRAARAVA
jgi:hypothetical protein